MRKFGSICASLMFAFGVAVSSADAHDRNVVRTAAAVGVGYLLFPWSLLFPAVYGGADYLEPINPPATAPAPAAAKPTCVKTNVARLANACPAVAATSG